MSMVPLLCDILSTVGFSKSEAYPVHYKKASILLKPIGASLSGNFLSVILPHLN